MKTINLKSQVVKDEYTDYIQEAFDLEVNDVAEVQIPNRLYLDGMKDWNIGVICGASGSGKSTILKSLGEVYQPTFDNSKCLISNFDNMTPKEATMLLSSMGLASVPTWIRPYNVLSNGEKYRADLAMTLAKHKDGIILVDEYTSVVDRNVAKSMSNALQKYVRRNNIKIILATCHYDIFDWLQPDWIYDLNKGGTLERGECLRQRPQIELQMYRTEYDTWNLFKKHHYMTQELNKSASCYVFTWEDKIVAFCGVLAQFGKGVYNGFRISRLVVLPDFQGMGIGSCISDFIGGIYKNEDKTIYIKTINPRLGEYFKNSEKWSPSGSNGKYRDELSEHNKNTLYVGGFSRASYCYKYVGKPISGYSNIIKKTDEMRRDKSNEGQLLLWDI